MLTKDFSFELPDDLIAQEPTNPRDACRLMVLNKSEQIVEHKHFYDLTSYLKKGDVLVMNNSKVFPARILFEHNSKKVELFLHRHLQHNEWLCIGKPGKVLQPGTVFDIAPDFSFEVLEILPATLPDR